MAKCRECEHLIYVPVCHDDGEMMPCGSENDTHKCEDYKPRETPLLVDVLAKALNDMVEIFNRADDADIYPDSCQGWDDVIAAAINALARYQKEVDGA